MNRKNKKKCGRWLRCLCLILSLSMLCLPMTAMASANELDEMEMQITESLPEWDEEAPVDDTEPADTEVPEETKYPDDTELPDETESPEETGSIEETEPTEGTEPIPSEEPDTPPETEADYEVEADVPDGWHTEPVKLVIWLTDVNETGWQTVEAALSKDTDAERTDLTEAFQTDGFAEYTVSDNGIVYFFITAPDGTEHTEELEVDCFDFDPPKIRGGIDGAMLHIEAFDERSGMAGIYVNDELYTTLQNGVLNIRIDQTEKERYFYIQGEDCLGNRSDYVVLANPFYQEPKPEPEEPDEKEDDTHGIHCSEDCDCRKPSQPSGSTGNTGNSGNTGNTGNSGSNVGSGGGSVQKPATTPGQSSGNSATDGEKNPKPAEKEPVTIEKGEPFSENGSAVTRDLLYDKHSNKQFITVETRNGEILYVVIDYDKPIDEKGEQYETYFLNLVDESDLLALIDEEKTVPVCTCKEKCQAGAVNTACEVCKMNMTECAGKEAVKEPEPTTEPEPEPEKKESGSGAILMVVLLLALGGGGALYWFKFRKEKPNTKGSVDLDDYDYGDEDDEEYETEPDDAAEEENE